MLQRALIDFRQSFWNNLIKLVEQDSSLLHEEITKRFQKNVDSNLHPKIVKDAEYIWWELSSIKRISFSINQRMINIVPYVRSYLQGSEFGLRLGYYKGLVDGKNPPEKDEIPI